LRAPEVDTEVFERSGCIYRGKTAQQLLPLQRNMGRISRAALTAHIPIYRKVQIHPIPLMSKPLWIKSLMGVYLLLDAPMGLAQDVRVTNVVDESTTIIAQGILDYNNVILIGETRLDMITQVIPSASLRAVLPVKSTLNLTPIAPLTVLRGKNIPANFIWVQKDPYPLRFRTRRIYNNPKLAFEGVWIFFLKPVSRIPKALSADSSEVSQKIFQYDRSASPHQLAKEFGVDTWFNESNWFELAFDYSAFHLQGRTIRELPLPEQLNSNLRIQLTEFYEKVRNIRKNQKTKIKESEFSISAKQLKEIETLIKLFQNPNSPPSIEQLLELKSEFSDAILREIGKKAPSELNEGLRTLKESLPEKFLNRKTENLSTP